MSPIRSNRGLIAYLPDRGSHSPKGRSLVRSPRKSIGSTFWRRQNAGAAKRVLLLAAPKAKAPLTSIMTGYPMQLVAMDILGPLPESPAGNTHVLIVADYFTRWTEAYAIPNQEATIVAQKLVDEFFFRFSPPEQLHSDQKRNFESEVIPMICKLLGVVKSQTTPYHPQSDGLVERYNRTLLTMLATAVREHPFKWEEHLHRLCLAYNTSVNPTTRHSPFFLMFGCQVRMPVEIMYGSQTQRETTVSQYVAMWLTFRPA